MKKINLNPVLLTTIFILILTIALMLAVIASAQDIDTNQLYACVNSESGLARFGDSDIECRSNEYLIVWNIIGPQGPQGEPGTFAFAGLHCPEGESIVGYDVDGTPLCTNGPIGPEPSEEICDGVDNDLDGQVDENYNYCISGSIAPNSDGQYCLSGFLDTNGIVQDGCENTGIFSIDGITPSFWGIASPAPELNLTGSGLIGAKFYVDQTELNVISEDEGLGQVVLQAPVIVEPGEYMIRAEKMGALTAIEFFVYDFPKVNSIAPTYLEGGCGSLNIVGEDFIPYTSVQVSDHSTNTIVEIEVDYYSSNQIIATIACTDPLQPGDYDLIVTNGPGHQDTLQYALVVP